MKQKVKYKSLKEWREAHPREYAAAKKPNSEYPIEEICEDFGWVNNKWHTLSDEELINKTLKEVFLFIKHNPNKKQIICKHIGTPLKHMRKRGLKDIFYKKMGWSMNMNYKNMSDNELINHGKKYCSNYKITTISGLNNWTGYRYLIERNLINKFKNEMNFGNNKINWCVLSNNEVLKKFIELYNSHEKGKGLTNINYSGYNTLKNRNLLELFYKKVNYSKNRIDWYKMSDIELIENLSQVYINNNCKTLTELGKYAIGGVAHLRKRKGCMKKFENKTNFKNSIKWIKLSDDEVFKIALKLIDNNGCNSIEELKKSKQGDSCVEQLRKRKLINKLLKKRNWKMRIKWEEMSKSELLKYSISNAKEKKCKNISDFRQKVGGNPIKYMTKYKIFEKFLKKIGWEKTYKLNAFKNGYLKKLNKI